MFFVGVNDRSYCQNKITEKLNDTYLKAITHLDGPVYEKLTEPYMGFAAATTLHRAFKDA